MLTETSLGFISFINYFLLPIISVRIYNKRHTNEWKFSAELMYQYALMCVLNVSIGRIVVSIAQKILSTTITAEMTKYTLIAMVVAVIIPIVMEVIEKFFKIEVEVKSDDTEE